MIAATHGNIFLMVKRVALRYGWDRALGKSYNTLENALETGGIHNDECQKLLWGQAILKARVLSGANGVANAS